jgi:hypothetical protein
MRDPAKTRNGRNPNSRLAQKVGGARVNLRDKLLDRLIADGRCNRGTSNADSIAAGGTQYGARIFELKERGWIIDNRPGWHWINFDAMRTNGRHDLLAFVFPEKYPAGPPTVPIPLPPPSETIPMFGTGATEESYRYPE